MTGFALSWVLIPSVLAFLLTLCVHRHVSLIQTDLSVRVQKQLKQSGYHLQAVRVDGRDVFVGGAATTVDADRIVRIVRSVPGVREVWKHFRLVSLETFDVEPLSLDTENPVNALESTWPT